MTRYDITVLDFVRARITEAGFAPSYDEIAAHAGISSKGHAHRIVGRLIEGGHLAKQAGRKRGLILPGGPDLRTVDTAAMLAELRRRGVEPSAFNADRPRRQAGEVACAVDCCGTPVERGHMFCREHYWAITEITRRRLFRAHKRYRSSRRREDEREYQAAYQAALSEATA